MLRQSAWDKLQRAKKADPSVDGKAVEEIQPKFVLGRINLYASTAHDRSLLRLEYTRFKDRSGFTLLLLPTFALLIHRFDFRDVSSSMTLVHVFTLYYFIFALREYVLLINGSRIARWWIKFITYPRSGL